MTDRATPAPSALALSDDLRVAVGRLRRRLRDVSTAEDITASQSAVLTLLGKDVAVTASALAAAEGITPQSMGAIIAALVDRGLVGRSPDPEDGRKQILALTVAGRERLSGERRARGAWLAGALEDHFDADERRCLAEAVVLLERLNGIA